jgi:hypothetical protein
MALKHVDGYRMVITKLWLMGAGLCSITAVPILSMCIRTNDK